MQVIFSENLQPVDIMAQAIDLSIFDTSRLQQQQWPEDSNNNNKDILGQAIEIADISL